MGKFELRMDSSKNFRFILKARNGWPILNSRPFPSKQGCIMGIENLRECCWEGNSFERRMAQDGLLYFEVADLSGQVLASSEHYTHIAAVRRGIASVRSNAPSAEVLDMTTF